MLGTSKRVYTINLKVRWTSPTT